MRGKQAPKRQLAADEIYNSQLVTKLINFIMQDGKKHVARKSVYSAMDELATKTKAKPLEALETAIENVKPKIEVRSRRVGGSNYQVPVPVPEGRQTALALRWIIEAARKNRGGAEFYKSLARELADAFNKEGNAIRKKEDVKKMADANKAFAQFA
ncbi:30S ribosomal protein S7 [Candidatus Dojkabacteria bacterium]|uniref:Small ribosomal subunit protein uS7 n=1 Tax=Candidatus Dojkabacteria bacterium TaxID=2099670 RepID=A0A955L9U0_9BACT|nr:30S ribosomal protein S7 [Candidatus Dojkabacteria bacterium]